MLNNALNTISLVQYGPFTLALIGGYYGLLTSLSVGISHVLCIRACLFELKTEKGSVLISMFKNKVIIATMGGLIVAQVLVFASIYFEPLYILLIRPHLWAIILWPYTLSYVTQMLFGVPPIRSIKSQYKLEDPNELRNVFFNSFFGQILNPVLLTSPVFTRLTTVFLFRYSHVGMFLTGTIIGSIGGQFLFLFMIYFLFLQLERSVPLASRSFNILFFRLFNYFAWFLLLAFLSRTPISLFRRTFPLLDLERIRLRDPWPALLYDSAMDNRPFWFPSGFRLERDRFVLAQNTYKDLDDQETLNIYEQKRIEEQEEEDKRKEEEKRKREEREKAKAKAKNKEENKEENIEENIVADIEQDIEQDIDQNIPEHTEENKPEKKKVKEEEEEEVRDYKDQFINGKRFSQYFFEVCISTGKQRLLHNYPQSLSIFRSSIAKSLDIPNISQQNEDTTYNQWVESKIIRRKDMYDAIAERMAELDKGATIESVRYNKLKSLKYLNIEDEKGDQGNNGIISNNAEHIHNTEYIDVEVVEKLGCTKKLVDPRLQKISECQRLPKFRGFGAIEPDSIEIEALQLEEQKNIFFNNSNKLREWISLQSEALDNTILVPWQLLNTEARTILPLVLNNQETNATKKEHGFLDADIEETKDYLMHTHLSWEIFVQLYSSPIYKKLPDPEEINTWHSLFAFCKYLCTYNIEFIKNKLFFSEKNKKILFNKIVALVDLYKSTPLLQIQNTRDVKYVETLPEGRKPVGPVLNRETIAGTMLNRRRKVFMLKNRDKRPRTPLIFRFQQKSRHLTVQGTKKKQSTLSALEEELGLNMPQKTRKVDVEYIGGIMQRVRGPVLIAQVIFRKYIKLPLLICLKNTGRLILLQKAEFTEDFADWSKEHYIYCEYDGSEIKPKTEEEIEAELLEEEEKAKQFEDLKNRVKSVFSILHQPLFDRLKRIINIERYLSAEEIQRQEERKRIEAQKAEAKKNIKAEERKKKEKLQQANQLIRKKPDEWWGEGLQVKVLNPLRLTPWRVSKDDAAECYEDFKRIDDTIITDNEIQNYFKLKELDALEKRDDLEKEEDALDEADELEEDDELEEENELDEQDYMQKSPVKQDNVIKEDDDDEDDYDEDENKPTSDEYYLDRMLNLSTNQPEYSYLTVFGREVDQPFGSFKRIPSFWKPVFRASQLLIRGQISHIIVKLNRIYSPVYISISKGTRAIHNSILSMLREMLPDRMFQLWVRRSSFITSVNDKNKIIETDKLDRETEVVLREDENEFASENLETIMITQRNLDRYKTNQAQLSDRYQNVRRRLSGSILNRERNVMKKHFLPSRDVKFSKKIQYKWIQIKTLWINIRRQLIYIQKSISIFVNIELPTWIKLQIKLLPIRRQLLSQKIVYYVFENKVAIEEFVFNLQQDLQIRYISWKFRKEIGEEIESELRRNIRKDPDQYSISQAYILSKIWQMKLFTNPYLTQIDQYWSSKQPLKKEIKDLLDKEGLLCVNAFDQFNIVQWEQWLQDLPSYSPTEEFWSLLSEDNYDTKISSIDQSNDYSMKQYHKPLINEAQNWLRRWKWYQLMKSYTNAYEGLRKVSSGYQEGKITYETYDANSYVKSYRIQNIDHLDIYKDEVEDKDTCPILVNDEENPQDFVFDLPIELSIPLNRTEDKFDPYSLLLFQNKFGSVWQEEQIRAFINFMCRDLTGTDQQIKDTLNKPNTASSLLLIKYLYLGGDIESNEITGSYVYELANNVQAIEKYHKNWRVKHFEEWVFLYNFISPILEYAGPDEFKAESDTQKLVRFLLNESNIYSHPSFILSWIPEDIMPAHINREFRILESLNLNKDLDSYNKSNQADQLIKDDLSLNTNRNHWKNHSSNYGLIKRFLWPTHRLEDLACINRFWLGININSKFSPLRISMYPFIKP